MSPKKPPTNIPASINSRLKAIAREKAVDLNNLLSRYAGERLLYRLSQSQYKEQYILKGGTLFYIWNSGSYRPTKDLDFLSFGLNSVSDIEKIFHEICLIECEDGIIFLPESIRGQVIKENQQYQGVRVKVKGNLGTVSFSLQVDIGFGDVVTPDAKEEVINTILDLPKPILRIYPPETVIAEKFQIMVSLGIRNSRLKDFYDIWFLSKENEFNGDLLSQAINKTFQRRNTVIPAIEPLALTQEFFGDQDRQKQWRNFLKNNGIQQIEFDVIVADIKNFIMPLCLASSKNENFDKVWKPEGYWQESNKTP